ncbi:MAG: hypothetical protein HYV33_02225 [Candidatus Kerfeldbacteria bacterium]|nr:hypothetical protein [Candidatus Kerfeldbacteria bacterium]
MNKIVLSLLTSLIVITFYQPVLASTNDVTALTSNQQVSYQKCEIMHQA